MRDDNSKLGEVAGVMGGIAVRVIFITLMVLATVVSMKYCFSFGRDVFYQEAAEEAPGHDIELEIQKGDDLAETAQLLHDEGLVRNPKAFELQCRLYKLRLYPGTYRLNTSMTSRELIRTMNLTEEEYEQRKKAAEAAKAASEEAVYGEGSDLVDEEQAMAAAAAGIEVETDAQTAADSPAESAEEGTD